MKDIFETNIFNGRIVDLHEKLSGMTMGKTKKNTLKYKLTADDLVANYKDHSLLILAQPQGEGEEFYINCIRLSDEEISIYSGDKTLTASTKSGCGKKIHDLLSRIKLRF